MKKTIFRPLLAAAALTLVATAAHGADTLATWPLKNTLEGTSGFPDALTVGAITNGSAVGKPGIGDNGMSGESWTSPSRNENAYFQFTVKASADYYLKPDELVLNLRSTSKGPPHVEIRHSLNGSTWSTTGTFDVDLDGAGHDFSIDCDGITVNGGQTLTFRIYAWGAEQAGGTFRLGNKSPMILSGTAVGTKLPPTIVFPNEAEAVAVSNKLTVDISVLPAGSGIQEWSFLPKPVGTYALSNKQFTFTPAKADEGGPFTLSVTATNNYGSSTAGLPVTVTEYLPPGSWSTGFETGADPRSPRSPTNIVIDGKTWTIQQLSFNSSNSTPKIGARACVFGNYTEAYMVSAEKLLDASNGFGTVSFQYAAFPGETEPCQPLIIESATDLEMGNWAELGRVNPNGQDTLVHEEFVMNVTEPVYLRIRTEYVNGSGRVVLDQLAVKPYIAPTWTAFEQYLLDYNVTPGDPGCASQNFWAEGEDAESYLTDDFDEDGYSNWAEFNANPRTNPYDKTSHP